MTLTPVEIHHVRLSRRLTGYDCKATDRLLDEIAASFEEVWRERADLHDEIERLEGELASFREAETLLRKALVAAERASEEVRMQARREADLILEEARVSAREVAASGEGERERALAEIRRLELLDREMRASYRAFLLSALEQLERRPEAEPGSSQAA